MIEPGAPVYRLRVNCDLCNVACTLPFTGRFIATKPVNHMQTCQQQEQRISRGILNWRIDGDTFQPARDTSFQDKGAHAELAGIQRSWHCRARGSAQLLPAEVTVLARCWERPRARRG